MSYQSSDYLIYHLACGGTIDSHWDGAKDTAVPNLITVVPKYLRESARIMNVDSETMFLKDSREITIDDQDLIAARVAETSSARRKVLITIGTYLMPDVARVVQNQPMAIHFKRLDRRIILTGSVIPMKGYLKSDGGFNLGMSVALLLQESSGNVQVVMNGSCLNPEHIRKDLSTASFSSLNVIRDNLTFDAFDVITAGGTIDFVLNGLDGLVPGSESFVPIYLRESVRVRKRVYTVNPYLDDSRNMTPNDYDLILNMIQGSKTDRIIITSGIYRLAELRKFLMGKSGVQEKTIILTGSRLPLTISDDSDAPFQLGFAYGMLGFLKPGIYIALNGRVLGSDDDPVQVIYTTQELKKLEHDKLQTP